MEAVCLMSGCLGNAITACDINDLIKGQTSSCMSSLMIDRLIKLYKKLVYRWNLILLNVSEYHGLHSNGRYMEFSEIYQTLLNISLGSPFKEV